MIVKTHRQTSFHLLITMQGSVIPAIAPKILLAATLGVVAQLVNNGQLGETDDISNFSFSPFTALGVAISLFLGFHNNASYSRWWEARQLWGAQIIAVRNLIRFLLGSLESGDETSVNNIEETVEGDLEGGVNDGESSAKDWREKVILLTVAQTHALRSQLRPSCKADVPRSALDDRNRFLGATDRILIEKAPNPANAILLYATKILGKAPLTEYNRVHASVLIDRFCEIQTACERIHNTSLPLAYSLLVHRTAFLFVILAPFGMTTTMGWWTPLFTAILAYTFFGLDELARQIQEPFRDEPHCLALSAMCRTVEIDVFHALGREIPPPLQPVDLVLM
jgi:ion channel-forming bestrophin family protein